MREKVSCGVEYLFLGLCDMAQRNRYQVTRRPTRRASTFAESGMYLTSVYETNIQSSEYMYDVHLLVDLSLTAVDAACCAR
jgi:hypothetical protein